jgi:hypothetical protein
MSFAPGLQKNNHLRVIGKLAKRPNVSPNLSHRSDGNRPTPTSALLTKTRSRMETVSVKRTAGAGARPGGQRESDRCYC